MTVRIINQAEVFELLPMAECIELMEQALLALANDQALMPLRQVMLLPGQRGVLASMPAYLGDPETIGLKTISVFPGNAGTELDSHQGTVQLFDAANGSLRAIIDATAVTEIRTAAVSGVATRLLSSETAEHLAILGSGAQARSHLEAMLAVRDLQRIRLWSRTMRNAERFATREGEKHGVAIDVQASVEENVAGADLICTTTAADKLVLCGDWISPGAHINAVGSSVPSARELNTGAIVRASLFVDRRESTVNEAGDFLIPKSEGAIDESHILAELGEIIGGKHPGRRTPDEITVFKSLGLAIEDLAAAQHIYQKARELGVGQSVELGGRRQTDW